MDEEDDGIRMKLTQRTLNFETKLQMVEICQLSSDTVDFRP